MSNLISRLTGLFVFGRKKTPPRRRDYPRVKLLDRDIEIRIGENLYSNQTGKLVNLSYSGALIRYPFKLPLETEFVWVLQDTGYNITGKTISRYQITGGDYLVRVKFSSPISDQEVIERYGLREWQ